MRVARWCFILFQLIWLNAILPGHTRGIVTLPGGSSGAGGGGSMRAGAVDEHGCCAAGSAARRSAHDEKGTPTPAEKRSRCAVCFFAATMAAAAPQVSPLAPLHLIDTVPALAAALAPSVDRPFTYLGRGPPAA